MLSQIDTDLSFVPSFSASCRKEDYVRRSQLRAFQLLVAGIIAAVVLLFVPSSALAQSLSTLAPALKPLNSQPIFESQAQIFSDKEAKFIGIIGDTSSWLSGSDAELRGDGYAAIRKVLKSDDELKFQSEEPLTFVKNGKFKVARSRILLRCGLYTVVINEEHRIGADKKAYSLFLVSLLSNESAALKARDQLAAKFSETTQASNGFKLRWLENLLIEEAFARGRVSEARSAAPARKSTAASGPAKKSPDSTLKAAVASCGANVWNSLKSTTELLAKSQGPTRLGNAIPVLGWLQKTLFRVNPAMGLATHLAESAVDAGRALIDSQANIFSMAWKALSDVYPDFRSKPTFEQIGLVCAALLEVGTMVIPGGAGAKVARLASLLRAEATRLAAGATRKTTQVAATAASRLRTAATKVRATAPKPRVATDRGEVKGGAPAQRQPSAAVKLKPKVVSHGDFKVMASAPKVSRTSIADSFRAKFPTQPNGARAVIDLPSSPSSSANALKLNPTETKAINDWAEEVLDIAQKAHPEQKLKIENVSVGVGFRAQDSMVHIDGGGTFMHASSTLKGGTSTVMFKPAARDKILAAENAMRTDGDGFAVSKIKSRNQDGSMTVEISGRPSSDIEPRTLTIKPDEYMQPEAETTAIFSGAGHRNAKPDVVPAFHASPLADEVANPSDRVTFFVNIKPVDK